MHHGRLPYALNRPNVRERPAIHALVHRPPPLSFMFSFAILTYLLHGPPTGSRRHPHASHPRDLRRLFLLHLSGWPHPGTGRLVLWISPQTAILGRPGRQRPGPGVGRCMLVAVPIANTQDTPGFLVDSLRRAYFRRRLRYSSGAHPPPAQAAPDLWRSGSARRPARHYMDADQGESPADSTKGIPAAVASCHRIAAISAPEPTTWSRVAWHKVLVGLWFTSTHSRTKGLRLQKGFAAGRKNQSD